MRTHNFVTPISNNGGVSKHQSPSGVNPLHWTDLLLAHPAITAEYILEIADGVWECRCGNTHDSDGFEACDELGRVVEPVLGTWDGALHLCTRCYRIISGDSLEVLGSASMAVVEVNEEYRWMPQR